MASWDVDEAQGCDGWIVLQTFGRYNLTLTADTLLGENDDLGGVFCPFGGLMGAP